MDCKCQEEEEPLGQVISQHQVEAPTPAALLTSGGATPARCPSSARVTQCLR